MTADAAGPLPLHSVVEQERDLLRKDGEAGPLAALCISGGGIRSATFGLGVLQGLAEHGVLDQFDYLSTVSGGGYIGSWLSAWIYNTRLALERESGPLDETSPGKEALDEVIGRLRCDGGPCHVESEDGADPIEHLREYNNYLTPRLGLFSADTWTLAATVGRNMLLNWMVLIPVLMAILVLPRLVLAVARLATDLHYTDAAMGNFAWLGAGVAGVLFAVAIVNSLRYMPGVGGREHNDRDFLKACLAPVVLAALSLTVAGSWVYFPPAGVKAPSSGIFPCVALGVNCLASWLIYLIFFHRPAPPREDGTTRQTMSKWMVTLAIALLGITTGATLWLAGQKALLPADWSQYVTIGPPVMLSGFALAACLFVGLTSGQLQDEDREWLSRAAAWLGMFMAIWLAVCGLVLLAPRLVYQSAILKSVSTAVGALSGWAGALAGYSTKSKASPGRRESDQSSPLVSLAVKLAPPLFLTALLIGLAITTNITVVGLGRAVHAHSWTWVRGHTPAQMAHLVPAFQPGSLASASHEKMLEREPWWLVALAGGILLSAGMLMARFINVNIFSLQAMYRNRLIRAYLGASNHKPKGVSFTGFWPGDNIRMCVLKAQRPFHVVNMTLNLVSGERLAWQQRKAESFTVSPLHSGSAALGYRPTELYGEGITLGTAMSISGAAASPSMGYHSSPPIGFIMTLFNARLGCWLGNPGKRGDDAWKDPGPRSAARSLAREALGLTNDDSPYVYLSDGGHFENLGLYEMVRRRCGRIVVVDAGCDPEFSYEDLGNALRKIRIDFGIEIAFDDADLRALNARKSRSAAARIRYSMADSACEDGVLLYIKPMLLGNEPPDVESYHRAHPDFPHEGTGDQWFNESQTESYRMLGLLTVRDICSGRKAGSLEGLFAPMERAASKVSAAAG